MEKTKLKLSKYLSLFSAISVATLLAMNLNFSAHRIYVILSWVPIDAVAFDTHIGLKREVKHFDQTSTYSVTWVFNYEVAHRKYQSVADSGLSTSTKAKMQSWSRQFPRGTIHHIRYNPDSPNEISVFGWDLNTFQYSIELLGWTVGVIFIYFLLRVVQKVYLVSKKREL